MHAEIVRDGPGNCPICGMGLEMTGLPADEPNPELIEMKRRFWIGAALAARSWFSTWRGIFLV